VINNEVETGVTIMQMDEGMDTGDILLPARLSITPDDTAASLAPKLSELGGQTLVAALDLLRENKLIAGQQDNSLATLAPPLTKEQGRIDWAQPAKIISGLIRGLDPWPSAVTAMAGRRYKIFAPRVITGHSNEQPGTLLRADAEGLLIATSDDLLLIRDIQPEGSRRMAVGAFLQGHTLPAGEIFR
jgi:methionyl-tRNA formyltransferase